MEDEGALEAIVLDMGFSRAEKAGRWCFRSRLAPCGTRVICSDLLLSLIY